MMKEDGLFRQLDALQLPKGSYAIFAGGPMSVRGLKDFHDIDLVVTSELFEEFLKKPGWKLSREHGEILSCGDIEMVRKWEMGGWDEQKLIAEADIIDGRPYVRLEEVLKWKKLRMTPKDIKDIGILEKYLEHSPIKEE